MSFSKSQNSNFHFNNQIGKSHLRIRFPKNKFILLITINMLILNISRFIYNGSQSPNYQEQVINKQSNQKPIILVHGILSNAKAMTPVYNKLKQIYPETYVVQMEIGNGKFDSVFMKFDKQVDKLYFNIKKDKYLQDGINLLCHSQGSHICLMLSLKYGQELKINKVILESGAFLGWNCLDNTNISQLQCHFKNQQKFSNLLHKIPFSGKLVSYIQVWDPEKNKQNQCLSKIRPNDIYKQNLNYIKELILVTSVNDGIIVPYQSTHFGYYKDFYNGDYSIIPLQQQQIYTEDWIGIKQLDSTNRLTFITLDNITHTDYNKQETQDFLANNIYNHFNEF